MSAFVPPGAVGGAGGAGLKLRTPPDIFAGATRNAAETARNNGLNAAARAEFDDDPNLALILRIGGVDTWQVRRSGAWRDVTNVVRGPAGPGPSDAQVTAAVQAGVKAYARTGGPVVPEPEIDPAIMRVAQQRTPAAVKAAYESNADTNAYTDAEKALVASVASPIRMVGLLQWDINPAIIEGRAASDLEATFRAQFETPYLPLTDYYFEVWAVDPAGVGQILHARTRWAQVTHLDIAIDALEAGNIAAGLLDDHDHLEIELRFFADSVTFATAATTGRRILIIEDDGSGNGTTDSVARSAAATAQTTAAQARQAAAANAARLDALPSYAALMEVWPPNVARHSDFQRSFQSTLAGLSPALATDAGSTGTRFTNTFQILTRLANDTVVQLHTQGWAVTEDDRQTIPWAVSAAEFNAVGASAATNGIEVWGEFRAIYGGGVDELRGRTNPFFIDFGEEADWPVTRGDAVRAIADASDLGFASIGTTAAFDAFLAKQADSAKPTLTLFTAAIANHRYQGGPTFNIVENQLRYFKPGNTIGTNFFVLPGGADSGQSASQVMAAIEAALPPFADIRLLPEAVPGSQVPDDFYLELAGKLTSREIDGITLLISGQTIRPHASTPVSGFDTETQALIRFDVSSVADAIANSINASDRTLQVDLTFGFTEGDDFARRILLPVNNPNAPRLVQGELDTIAFNAALTLDWLAPDMRSITLTDDITFAFSNILVGRPLVLEVRQGGAGGHGITWPSSVEWAGGAAEGPSSGAGDADIFTLLPLSGARVVAAALLDVS